MKHIYEKGKLKSLYIKIKKLQIEQNYLLCA